MDVGTAKATAAQRAAVPHHGLDLVDPDVPFTAADYRRAALSALGGIAERGRLALLVGGTGLYLRAVARGLALDDTGADPAVRAESRAPTTPTLGSPRWSRSSGNVTRRRRRTSTCTIRVASSVRWSGPPSPARPRHRPRTAIQRPCGGSASPLIPSSTGRLSRPAPTSNSGPACSRKRRRCASASMPRHR